MNDYMHEPEDLTRGPDSVLDSEVPTWYRPTDIRYPDTIAWYNPLERLWQADELADSQQQDYTGPRLVSAPSYSYPWLDEHMKECPGDITAIVHGATKQICKTCSEAWCLVADVEEVQSIEKEAA